MLMHDALRGDALDVQTRLRSKLIEIDLLTGGSTGGSAAFATIEKMPVGTINCNTKNAAAVRNEE
jgi:hypothetical protein